MRVTKTVKRTLFAAGAVSVFALSGPAVVQAQSYDRSAAAAAEVRFQQLEKEIRRLTGQIEEQNYKIRQLQEKLETVTGDLGVRISALENGSAPLDVRPAVSLGEEPSEARTGQNAQDLGAPPMGATDNARDMTATNTQEKELGEPQTLGTLRTSQAGQEVSSQDAAPRAYDAAYAHIKNRDFGQAEKAFAAFMRNYPDSPLVSNAQYWYGETFYVRGNYEKAARIFAEGYQNYPKSSKAASNLLKLGMSLAGMGKTEDACIAYQQLEKEYSKSSIPVLKRAQTEMKKINCQ